MKILHIINGLGSGGAERLVSQLCIGLSKNNEVTLVSINSNNNIFAEFEQENINYVTFKEDGFFSINKLIKLFSLIKKSDVVHAHLFPTLYIVSFLSIFLRSKKFIFTEHNTVNRRRSIKILKPFEKIIYNNYNTIINISPAVKTELQNWIGPNHNFFVIPNFVDAKVIKNSKSYSRNDFFYKSEDVLLVMVGSFTSQKDQIAVIRCLSFLPSQYKLLLIGDGNLKCEIEKEIESLNLKTRVNLLGIRKDVFSILKFCDYGILSSNWEGFGLVALEYMASGLIALGTNVEGLNSVISNQNNLFKIGDSKALSKRILELETNKNLKEKIIEEQNLSLSKFTLNNSIEKHLAIYNIFGKTNV